MDLNLNAVAYLTGQVISCSPQMGVFCMKNRFYVFSIQVL